MIDIDSFIPLDQWRSLQVNIWNLLTWFVESAAIPQIRISAARITRVLIFTKQVAEPVAEVIKESVAEAKKDTVEPVAEAKKDTVDTTPAIHQLKL